MSPVLLFLGPNSYLWDALFKKCWKVNVEYCYCAVQSLQTSLRLQGAELPSSLMHLHMQMWFLLVMRLRQSILWRIHGLLQICNEVMRLDLSDLSFFEKKIHNFGEDLQVDLRGPVETYEFQDYVFCVRSSRSNSFVR